MASDAELKLKVTGEDAGGSRVLKDTEKAAEDLGDAVDALAKKSGLDELTRDANESREAFKRAGQAFDRAVDRFKTAEGAPFFDKTSKAAQRLRAEIVKTGDRVTKLSKDIPPALKKASRGFRDVEKRVKAARAELTRFAKGARRIDTVVKSVTRLRTSVGLLQAAFGAAIAGRLISETIQLTTESVKLKTAIDLLTPALKSNLGSTDAAADAQAFLRSESDRLKVTIDTLGRSYVQLTAATKGTVIEGETTNRLFSAITEASKVLGASNEDVGRAFLGLSQAAGGANVQMQEVRQITEAIPGLFAAWAKELDLTQGELRGLIAEGGVAADQLATLADAAEALAGDTALAEQLRTTAGLFQQLEVQVQNVKIALAGELEPGLRDALEVLLAEESAVKALAQAFGETLSGELRETAAVFKIGTAAIQDFVSNAESLLGDTFVKKLGLDKLRDDLAGVPEAAAEAFEAVEEEALKAAGAVEDGSEATEILAESYGKLPEAARKAFRATTEAAKLDAGTRQRIASELAVEVAKITEESVKKRAALQKILVVAAREGGDEEIKVREFVAEQSEKIAREAVESARRLTEVRRQEAAKEIEIARRAAEERSKLFKTQVAAAQEAADEELALHTEAESDRVALERQLSEKLKKIEEERVKALEATDEKRVQLLKTNDEKIVQFAREAAQKRKALEEKLQGDVVKAAEKSADDRKKIEEKLQADLAGIREAAKAPDEEAGTGDDGAPVGLTETAAQVDGVTKSVSQLRDEVEELVRLGAQGQGLLDADAILKGKFAVLDATIPLREFGPVATQSAQEVGAAAQEIKGRFDEVISKIDETLKSEEFLASFREETAGAFQETLSGLIESFSTLAEAGLLTDADLQTLVETFTAFAGETAPENVDAITSIQESLAALSETTQEQIDATEKQNEALKTQVKVVEDAEGNITILQVAREKLADTEEEAVGVTEEVSEATEEAGEKSRAAAAPVGELATETQRLANAAGEASPGMEGLAGAAEKLSAVSPPTELAEGVDRIGASAPQAARGLADAAQAAGDLGATAQDVDALAAAVENLVLRLQDVAAAAAAAKAEVEALGRAQESVG